MKIVVWAGVAAIGLALVAGALTGHPTTRPTSAAGSLPSSASQVTAGVRGPSSTSAATASTTPTPPPVAAPALAMTCPSGGASPAFGHTITAVAPYVVDIAYGDGDKYRDTDQHLGAIFTHTYKTKGTYTVTAVLRQSDGQTATGSCTYTRVR